MQEPGTLEAALQMVDRFGASAEFQAGDEMDKALEVGDAGGFDKWRLIAETIAALTSRGPTISRNFRRVRLCEQASLSEN